MNRYMAIGTLTGLAVGLLIVAIILKVTKKDGSMKSKFDERQSNVRGKGFKIGFFTLMIYDGIYGLLGLMLDKPLTDPFAGMVIGICLSAAVYVVYCIWNNAYFSLNENPKKLLFAFGIIAFINLVPGSINIMRGNVVTDGILNFRIVNFICGLLFIIIFLALSARKIKDRSEMEQENL